MILLPAIDLYGGKAVRLYQGDYRQMTVYDKDPLNVVRKFEEAGAAHLHLVDLEGAKTGGTENRALIRRIAASTKLEIELGGGIRTMDTIANYLNDGIHRVILGTAAAANPEFAAEAAAKYGEQIAAGVDLRDGLVAVRGWTETSAYTGADFCKTMREAGIRTLICTDISRDGAMQGINLALYQELNNLSGVRIIASGGVSSLEDLRALAGLGLYGAILGKAYYTGAVGLKEALAICNGGII